MFGNNPLSALPSLISRLSPLPPLLSVSLSKKPGESEASSQLGNLSVVSAESDDHVVDEKSKARQPSTCVIGFELESINSFRFKGVRNIPQPPVPRSTLKIVCTAKYIIIITPHPWSHYRPRLNCPVASSNKRSGLDTRPHGASGLTPCSTGQTPSYSLTVLTWSVFGNLSVCVDQSSPLCFPEHAGSGYSEGGAQALQASEYPVEVMVKRWTEGGGQALQASEYPVEVMVKRWTEGGGQALQASEYPVEVMVKRWTEVVIKLFRHPSTLLK
ncbi:hypothetical protein RRG08_000516 [Elysia crispata]|uniref:Uncharacterized protein n=1 Tax=Elysia crispata TaxID=231223 RepID=A0AAE1CWS5_9GAST|nr:hypothetical protein RRG08_000516 [Elysia crispata]